jgi:hypothetical protein
LPGASEHNVSSPKHHSFIITIVSKLAGLRTCLTPNLSVTHTLLTAVAATLACSLRPFIITIICNQSINLHNPTFAQSLLGTISAHLALPDCSASQGCRIDLH